MRYRVAAATAYFAVLTSFAHGSDEAIPDWIVFAVIFIVPFTVGFIAGLWALIVPPLVVLLALPLGSGSGELPIWFVMLFIAFVAVPEIVIGWGASWVVRYYARDSNRRREANSGVHP